MNLISSGTTTLTIFIKVRFIKNEFYIDFHFQKYKNILKLSHELYIFNNRKN